MGVYTIKELDKLLPSVTSIAQQQVKDFLQALTDESLIRCEKIGSGNWYWCFLSDAKKGKENQINALEADEVRWIDDIRHVEAAIEDFEAREDEVMVGTAGGTIGRKELIKIHEELVREAGDLDVDLALFADCDTAEVTRKMEETKVLKDGALRWTDNIEALASYLGGFVGKENIVAAMAQACGDQYVVGEGLKELIDP